MKPASILPSRRLLVALAVASLLFLWSPAAALAVDTLLLLAAVADAFLAPDRSGFRIERRLPERIPLGARADVHFRAENRTPRTLRFRATDDLSAGLVREGADIYERVVGPGRTVEWSYTIRAEGRGTQPAGDLHLRLLGPLGLVWQMRREPRTDAVRVHPGVLEVRRFRLLGMRHRLRDAGLRSVRQRGEGGSFESLREYVRGDDPRTLDWKATARRGTPIVRRFEAERGQNVLIAIDAGRLMTERIGERERIDYALSAALLLADVAASHEDRIGLLIFADRVEQFIPPARLSRSRLADALAAVQPRLVEPNYPAAFIHLARNLRRRSLLVLFTDVGDTRVSSALIPHLIRAAHRHLPLVVALRNPELNAAALAPAESEADVFRRAAAEELLQGRARTLATLQRGGVLVADAHPRDAIPLVVNRYLEAKQRGTL